MAMPMAATHRGRPGPPCVVAAGQIPASGAGWRARPEKEKAKMLDGTEYRINFLLSHRELRCLIDIELNIDEFKPEYAGKMNFSAATQQPRPKGPRKLQHRYHHLQKQEPHDGRVRFAGC